MSFISHRWKDSNDNIQERLLSTHLQEVGSGTYKAVCQLVDADNNIQKASIIVGSFHDFGKYTCYFQNFIREKNPEGPKEHAFISALYGAFFAKKVGLPVEYQYMIYSSIKHHHTSLRNISEDVGSTNLKDGKLYSSNMQLNKELNEILPTQLNNIIENLSEINNDFQKVIQSFYSSLGTSNTFLEDFIDKGYEDSFNSLVDFEFQHCISSKEIDNPIRLLLLFSSLIDCDKFSASGISPSKSHQLNPSLVDSYRDKKYSGNKTSIDNLRDSLYNKVKINSMNVDLNNHFYTINAPTGSGKTIAAIMASLIFKHRIEDETKKKSKIIYSMPFLTLLEQNFRVVKSVLSEIADFQNNSETYLISHHHLSEITYIEDGKEMPLEEALLLVESWSSSVIVTTFVQLFETLLNSKNKMLKKLHNLMNSVIIIDEIQSIDVKLWETIKQIIMCFSRHFNMYFILMSATMPRILDRTIELSGVPEEVESRFSELNRYNVNIHINPASIQEIIQNYLSIYQEKSILFIFNTIESSLLAHKLANECLNKLGKSEKCIYISGNLTPFDKKVAINNISEQLSKRNKPVVVGTQIFEAGIDVDFDVVVRDLCPIDSIVQSGGRVNRNGNACEGTLVVVDASDRADPGHLSKIVYGSIHTNLSLSILKNYNNTIIPESDLRNIVKEYYQELRNRYPQNSSKYIDALAKFNFDTKLKEKSKIDYVSKFSIIENPNQKGIFIVENNEALSLMDEYKNLSSCKDVLERKRKFLKIRTEFYNYVLNVDLNGRKSKELKLESNSIEIGNFLFLPLDLVDKIYSKETGLLSQSNEEGLFS